MSSLPHARPHGQAGSTLVSLVPSLIISSGGSHMLDRIFSAIASRIAAFAGQPLAFIIAAATVVVWGVTGPLFDYSEVWQLVINTGTTIVTFLMVFLVQNSQNRDSAALQAKMDELIRAVDGARDEFIGIEHLTDKRIGEIRKRLEQEFGETDSKGTATATATVERLRKRL